MPWLARLYMLITHLEEDCYARPHGCEGSLSQNLHAAPLDVAPLCKYFMLSAERTTPTCISKRGRIMATAMTNYNSYKGLELFDLRLSGACKAMARELRLNLI